MKDNDVKIGMKVRVKSKSLGSAMESSSEIGMAEGFGHDYLYVSDITMKMDAGFYQPRDIPSALMETQMGTTS